MRHCQGFRAQSEEVEPKGAGICINIVAGIPVHSTLSFTIKVSYLLTSTWIGSEETRELGASICPGTVAQFCVTKSCNAHMARIAKDAGGWRGLAMATRRRAVGRGPRRPFPCLWIYCHSHDTLTAPFPHTRPTQTAHHLSRLRETSHFFLICPERVKHSATIESSAQGLNDASTSKEPATMPKAALAVTPLG